LGCASANLVIACTMCRLVLPWLLPWLCSALTGIFCAAICPSRGSKVAHSGTKFGENAFTRHTMKWIKALNQVKSESRGLSIRVKERSAGAKSRNSAGSSPLLFIASALLGVHRGVAPGLTLGVSAVAYGAHAVQWPASAASVVLCVSETDAHGPSDQVRPH